MNTDQIRCKLEESRGYIEEMWLQSEWFSYDVFAGGERPIFEQCGERIPTTNDLFEGWRSEFEEDVTADQVTVKPNGVCLAGSVLYAMGFTDQQWTNKAEVKPIIEALFATLMEDAGLKADYKKHRAKDIEVVRRRAHYEMLSASKTEKKVKESLYQSKLSFLIDWNDFQDRTKSEVVALFDRAIKRVIQKEA